MFMIFDLLWPVTLSWWLRFALFVDSLRFLLCYLVLVLIGRFELIDFQIIGLGVCICVCF